MFYRVFGVTNSLNEDNFIAYFTIFEAGISFMKQILYPILLLTIMLSCKSPVMEKLNTAESLLDQRPDSALLVLQSIDKKTLKTPRVEARYALFMSKALDKNYIDVSSDSLILKAEQYYSRHKSSKYKMLAYYYHGIVLINAKEYSSAIIALENAEKEALSLQDYHHLGLINRNKSNIFTYSNNNQEAIACMKKAIEHFEFANESKYKEYASYSLAVCYLNNKNYHEADSVLSTIIRSTEDNNLLHSSILRQASVMAHTYWNVDKAISNYRQVPKKYFRNLDYAYFALSFEKTGQRDSSNYWLREGYSHCRNQIDSATVDYVKSKIEMNRGHYQEAFNLIDYATNVQDSLTREILQQSVSVAQRDYYKSEAALQKERMIATKRTWTLLCTIAVLILAMVFAGIIWRSREKDRLLKDQMAHLAINNQTLEKVYKENALLLGSLFSSRIAHLDTLNERYYRLEEGKEKDAVFKEIKDCVASMRKNPEIYHSLEKDLDRYCDGVMTKLRAQVPRIKGENLKIIMLFFAGISDDVVHLLLNTTSAQSLRMTRSRFRKEILSAQAPDSELFLNMLMKKKAATEH